MFLTCLIRGCDMSDESIDNLYNDLMHCPEFVLYLCFRSIEVAFNCIHRHIAPATVDDERPVGQESCLL